MSSQLRLLSDLFQCHVDPTDRSQTSFISYLQHASRGKNHFLFQHNHRVWNVCRNLLPGKAACFLPKLFNQTCHLFPMRIAKTVRLRVAATERLLSDPRLPNLRVVVLVRDPRGVMSSRAAMDWCGRDACADPATACRHLSADIEAAHDLSSRYPGRVILLRYEDLSLDPYGVTDALLKFLDLPPSPALDRYILAHTGAVRKGGASRRNGLGRAQISQIRAKAKSNPNPYGLYRNSKVVP